MSARPQFCPLPVAAMGDDRLSGNDWRVLAAVAHHDRLGANGRHCYASTATLSAETRLHDKTISRSLARLREWGYIRVIYNSTDGRRRSYAVEYAKRFPPSGTGGKVTNLLPNSPRSIGSRSITKPAEIGNNHFRKSPLESTIGGDNISCETNTYCETEIHLVETRHAERDEDGGEPSSCLSQAEPHRIAHQRIVEGLGEELFAKALDTFIPAGWEHIYRLEIETPGAGIRCALDVLKGEGA
jgi:hypothetical protein